MEKRAIFGSKMLPYLLLGPQLLVTLVFFYWPASQAVWQSFLLQDAFGLRTDFIWFENYRDLFAQGDYYRAMGTTAFFSIAVAALSLSIALMLAVQADKHIKGAGVYKTLLIWPYAVAPAIAGVLWWFLFNPTIGVLPRMLAPLGIVWNHFLDGTQALILVIIASAWKQVSYNFLFFLAGLQTIPKALLEASQIDGAGPFTQFRRIVLPLLMPTTFFLLVINLVYAFCDTFAVIHATTSGGPGTATTTLVYKVFHDGFESLDLGGSAAQSVILMLIVGALTIIQFRYIERRIHY
jgi:sn-glycerol 3-phosphate transport system permease protein